MRRRPFLTLWLAPWAAAAGQPGPGASSPRAAVRFPDDFGGHPDARVEWWYVTGSLASGARRWGFQVTFFRASTGLAVDTASRFAARELVFAHAALTDLEARRLRQDQRIARSGFGIAEAARGETRVRLRDWSLVRAGPPGASRYHAELSSAPGAFALALDLGAHAEPLLQGEGGLSRKGPGAGAFSHYYSEPQLDVSGTLQLDDRTAAVRGRAWLDHEWSDAYLDPEAAGWDWIGMNLDDGGALMAFRMRRRDGGVHHAGGSWRAPGGGVVRDFAPAEVAFAPRRTWHSARSGATYPVEWDVTTPAGRYTVRALLDDQEIDSRASTGAIYWEGLSELLDARGAQVGAGYLEMTGYAAAMKL